LAATPPRSLPESALKHGGGGADREIDSRLGTDGNHEPDGECREGPADDAGLLISLSQFGIC
jgi:hypothetical protein